MTLQQLKYIITVAECGNTTEAAEKLFIAQPSLTSAIHSIEKELGITAIIHSNKGVELTRDGEALLSYARQVLEQIDVMTEHFNGERSQKPHFSVSCQHYSFALNAFVDVIRKYNADSYSFTLRETQTYEIIDDVFGEFTGEYDAVADYQNSHYINGEVDAFLAAMEEKYPLDEFAHFVLEAENPITLDSADKVLSNEKNKSEQRADKHT